MRHAVRYCERIPGLLQVVGADHRPTLKPAWATNVFPIGLALFRNGITDRPPLREETIPPPRLSSKPRIDAVFERSLAERALVLRSESMSNTRVGAASIRTMAGHRAPHLDSLDQLGREDMVAFMASVDRLRKIKHPDQRRGAGMLGCSVPGEWFSALGYGVQLPCLRVYGGFVRWRSAC